MEEIFRQQDEFAQFLRDVSSIPEHLNLQQIFDIYQKIKEDKARLSFYFALSRLQSELPAIKKNKKAEGSDGEIYFYASYDDIFFEIQPYLQKYGFSLRFDTAYEEKAVVVYCVLTHEDGHFETASFKATVQNTMDIQKWGAALTYAKRYSLSLLLGLATEEDNDAQRFYVSGSSRKKANDIEQEIEMAEEDFKEEFSLSKKPQKDEEDVEDIFAVDSSEEKYETKEEEEDETEEEFEPSTQNQIKAIFAILYSKYPKKSKQDFVDIVSSIIDRKIESISTDTISKAEASKIIETLKEEKEPF